MNKKALIAILLATIWIAFSEFIRNQIIFINTWRYHYESLGLEFNDKPINGAIWFIWSAIFASMIYLLALKYSINKTVAIAWTFGFVLMWLVIGNMQVLPYAILIFAIPLSIVEVYVATWIIKKILK